MPHGRGTPELARLRDSVARRPRLPGYPHQWLLLEAIEAHSSAGQRILEDLAVLDTYPDGMAAMNGYRELHRRDPQRELYAVHTDREALEVTEVHWLGSRAALDLDRLEVYPSF
jgi:hypothetical protein